MPWTEITKRFTASEMASMAFTNAEQMADIGKDVPDLNPEQEEGVKEFLEGGVANPQAMQYSDYSTKRGPVPPQEGDEMDMRNFKGRDLWNHFQKMGVAFPVMMKDRPKEEKG